jgi:hypothetical protein
LNRILRAIVLLIPIVALAGWFAYEQYPAWTRNRPDWLQPRHPTVVPGACAADASVMAYGGRYVSGGATVSAGESRQLTDELVAQQHDLPAESYALENASTLVQANFPEMGERLAWLNIALIEPAGDTVTGTEFGTVAIVYLDAATGDPLAYVVDVSARDPLTACGGGPVSRRELLRQYLPLALAVGYVGLVGLIGVGWWLLRRRRKSSQANRA